MVPKLLDAGIAETKIIHVTGHKDNRSLKSYARVSCPHKQQINNILNNVQKLVVIK